MKITMKRLRTGRARTVVPHMVKRYLFAGPTQQQDAIAVWVRDVHDGVREIDPTVEIVAESNFATITCRGEHAAEMAVGLEHLCQAATDKARDKEPEPQSEPTPEPPPAGRRGRRARRKPLQTVGPESE